ncbi:tyrosine-type recombinase/integrase [Lacticaseibacillus saniviri]|uniref:Integrase n=1 Tax=Lacticaseibacillus saniviri JCM 17471 = DSM 24301 TaxID=1293598 RepID=A0A0R2N146_9LACO|nr:site-specific integrase [Lacticaseibacillus saniviri]KRO16730.1 integrase [Lacticaseibacillus saniviri JCM 17471 = DSM 24301]
MASIRKRGKTWGYRISYKDISGSYKVKEKSGFALKRLAEEAAREAEVELQRGSAMDKSSTTLLDYYRYWIKTYKAGKHAQVTEERYSTIERHLQDYFGEDALLTAITRTQWQKFLNDFGEGRARETVSKLNSYVRSMADSAVADRIIYSNFTTGAVLTGSRPSKDKIKFLQDDDLSKLKDYAFQKASMDAMWGYIVVTGILTGARLSEIVGLTWADIDMDNATIDINKSWDYVHGGFFKDTKTEHSRRVIDIPTELVDLLKRLKKQQAELNLAQGYRDKDQLVFRNSRHIVVGDAGVNKSLKRAEDKLGIANPITFHGLRHSHVSYLLANGVDIAYISKRLGHANITITLGVYSHLLESTQKKQVALTLEALNAM